MLNYRRDLKQVARQLRRSMTDSERTLWGRLRRKQLLGIQFYRQKPVGDYIVDFFAPKARLVAEVDGSQHLSAEHAARDKQRDVDLSGLGLLVLRFDSSQVLKQTDAVVETIFQMLCERVEGANPP